MNKIELIEYLKIDNASGRKVRESNFKTNLTNIHSEIIKFNEQYFPNNEFIWRQKLYNYLYNIFEIPKCKKEDCKNHAKFYANENKYNDYCSSKCSVYLSQEQRKLTNIERYGVDNPMKNKQIKEKAENTLKLNFGVDNPSKSKEIQNKKIETFIKNYSTTHPMKNEDVKNKVKETCLERYNVTTTLLEENTKLKIEETNILLYGDKHAMKSDIVKEKLNNSNILKYGKIRYFLTDEYLAGLKIDNIEKTIDAYANKLNLSIEQISVVENGDLKIKDYCDLHSEFIISKNNLCNRLVYNVCICTECYPINSQISIGEQEIRNFIENNLNIKTEKIKINGNEVDIYLPDYKLGIEYDGLYWHTEKFKEKEYHLNKTIDCENEGIQLLHIFEDEWHNKKEIVKSLIKNKLKIFDIIIYADECTINKIEPELATNFLNSNCIYENFSCLSNFGLIFNNEIISIICFNENIESKEIEIYNLTNKLNTNIIGGTEILLNYIINIINPKKITINIDRRYSQGNLFKSLDFKLINTTEPKCWYYVPEEFDRFIRIPESLEHQIKNKEKSFKIFDCGYLIFEMNI